MPEDAAATAWSAGRLDGRAGPGKLLFGRMYEDSAIEERLIPPGARVFCIASAGCTAIRLAGARVVTAVDINPVQLEYAKARAAGAAMVPGAAERLMAPGRALLKLAGWSQAAVEKFLDLADPSEQIAFWHRHLNTRRFRVGLNLVMAPQWLRRFYAAPMLEPVPPHFGAVMRRRMERCWARHPNRGNEYARALLAPDPDAGAAGRPPAVSGIRWVRSEAAAFLESCAESSFDAFTVSHILDGTDPAYRARLMAAVRRAAAPGAVMVSRSIGEPRDPARRNLAADDRSFLWGVVEAGPAEELAAE